MPLCWCGERARGTGTRCARHRSTTQAYAYNSDSASIGHRHTGTRARHRHAHFPGDDNLLAHYDTGRALVRYSNHGNGYISNAQSNNLAQSVVQVLETSGDTHALSMAEISVNTPTGTYSFSAQPNLDREQCTVCNQWFPNRYQLECHKHEFPVGCEKCRVCLRRDSVVWHADMKKHDRCFVRDCESEVRRFGGWRSHFVERHIVETHYRGY